MEGMSTPESAVMSAAEYLEIERRSEVRHEYINGRMYAMSPGASNPHNLICTNLVVMLGSQTRNRSCFVYVADMRVKVGPTGMYTYPDIAALCGKPRFEDAEVDTLLNPSVIIEVLSKTTETYDRTEKFDHYDYIESLQEYVLVSQNRMAVDHFVRDAASWRLSKLGDPQALLRLAPIGCEVPLAEIYHGVEFSPADGSR